MITSLVLFLIVSVSSKQLPPEINKCRLSDPKIGDCLQVNVVDAAHKLKDGNKDLGLVPLEPLAIPKISFGRVSTGPVSLLQEYENLKFHDVINFTVSDTEVDFSDNNCHWDFKTHTPKMRMEADYKLTGQILVVPINGHGKSNNILYDSVGTYKIKCEKYTKRGKKHIRVTDLEFKAVPNRIVFDLENLVDGNEQLSRELLKTINYHSAIIYADIGPAFNEALSQLWKAMMNQVFSRVPQDELFLP